MAAASPIFARGHWSLLFAFDLRFISVQYALFENMFNSRMFNL